MSIFFLLLEKQPLFNMKGEPITAADLTIKIEAVWERFEPTNQITVEPIVTQATEDEATVTAEIAWKDEVAETERQVESYFRLQPSLYTGWDVVQTSLLDDLLTCM